MGFICAICRESLDHQPDGTPIIKSDNYDVLSTSCGHLFHTPCLQGCTNKKECPMCRKKYKITKLYPTEVDREDESLENAQLELKVIELSSQVKELKNEKKNLQSKFNDIEIDNTTLMNELVTAKDSHEQANELAQTLKVKLEAYKQFRELSRMQEKEIRDLKTNLNFYSSIKESVEKSASIVEEEYNTLSKNTDTIKMLLHSKNILQSKSESLKKENTNIKASSIDNFNKYKEMKEKYNELTNYTKKKEEEYIMFMNKRDNQVTSSSRILNNLNRTPDASETSPIFSSGINFKRKPSQLSLEKGQVGKSKLSQSQSLKRISQDQPKSNVYKKKSKIVEEDEIELTVTEKLNKLKKEHRAADDDIPFYVKQSIPLLGFGPTTKDGKRNPFHNFKSTDLMIKGVDLNFLKRNS